MLDTRVPPAGLLQGAALFLDFDGTLVEIAETPDAVTVDARLGGILRRLGERLNGRLAVITGRAAGQIQRLVPLDLLVVGSHGVEFVGKDGLGRTPRRPQELDVVLEAMRNLAKQQPGLIVEEKPLGAVLHFRQCASAEEECVGLATRLAAHHGLHLQRGKMMIEVRASGGDKGTAIRTLMREPPMAGTRPVFMGDDLTDEPGFVAAAELGGTGILVGEERETAAGYRLDGVEAALAWLEAATAKAA